MATLTHPDWYTIRTMLEASEGSSWARLSVQMTGRGEAARWAWMLTRSDNGGAYRTTAGEAASEAEAIEQAERVMAR